MQLCFMLYGIQQLLQWLFPEIISQKLKARLPSCQPDQVIFIQINFCAYEISVIPDIIDHAKPQRFFFETRDGYDTLIIHFPTYLSMIQPGSLVLQVMHLALTYTIEGTWYLPDDDRYRSSLAHQD